MLVFVGRRRDRRTVAHPTVRGTPLGALPPCAGGRLRRASLRGRQMHLWCIRVPAPPNGVHPPRRRAGHLGLPRAAHPRVVPKQGARSIYNERGGRKQQSAAKRPPPSDKHPTPSVLLLSTVLVTEFLAACLAACIAVLFVITAFNNLSNGVHPPFLSSSNPHALNEQHKHKQSQQRVVSVVGNSLPVQARKGRQAARSRVRIPPLHSSPVERSPVRFRVRARTGSNPTVARAARHAARAVPRETRGSRSRVRSSP